MNHEENQDKQENINNIYSEKEAKMIDIYNKGAERVSRQKYLEAAECFEEAYSMGSVDAAYGLAVLYKGGFLGKRRYAEAVKLLKLAAMNKHELAQQMWAEWSVELLFGRSPNAVLKEIVTKDNANLIHKGRNPLHESAVFTIDFKENFTLLYENGADINWRNTVTDKYHGTPVHLLIANELTQEAIFAIDMAKEKIDFGVKDAENKTIFMLAAKARNPEVALVILKTENKKNFDINEVDNQGNTALHYACALGQIELAMELLEAGADSNIKNTNGRKPLELVALSDENIIEILNEVYINAQRDEHAKYNDIKDKYEQPPITFADKKAHTIPALKCNRRDVDELIKEEIVDGYELGVNMAIVPMSKEDKKFFTEQFDKMSGVSLLDRIKKDREQLKWELIKQKNLNYGWLLRYAAANGDVETVKDFLKYSKDNINEKGQPSGKTALHFAAAAGHLDVCKLLVENGADMNAIDKDNNKAEDLAKPDSKVSKKSADIVKEEAKKKVYDYLTNPQTAILQQQKTFAPQQSSSGESKLEKSENELISTIERKTKNEKV